MPYIITTTKRTEKYYADSYPDDLDGPDITRHAVATLDEVNATVRAECERIGGGPRTVWTDPTIYRRCLHDGGTIGPLPDGTIIEVERVEPSVLGLRAGLIPADHPSLWPVADLVRVFNREHAPA